MAEFIVFIDSSEIREGKLQELKTAIHDLVEFVESNEPRPIAYNVYLNESGTRTTVVQVHPDSADIYGEPSDGLLEQMRQKVQMLGDSTVVVNERHAGFARFGTH